jgi:hypothetical protein
MSLVARFVNPFRLIIASTSISFWVEHQVLVLSARLHCRWPPGEPGARLRRLASGRVHTYGRGRSGWPGPVVTWSPVAVDTCKLIRGPWDRSCLYLRLEYGRHDCRAKWHWINSRSISSPGLYLLTL